VGQFLANFHVVGDVPRELFARIDRTVIVMECLTTLLLTVFTQSNYVADFLQVKWNFTRKMAVLRFQPHLEGGGRGLRDDVQCSS